MIIVDTHENVLNFFRNNGEVFGVDSIYVHGELQDKCGYDTFYVTRNDEYEKFMEELPDIFDVKVCVSDTMVIEGITEVVNAKAYVWEVNDRRRGLVILPTDTKACEYAQKKFDERASVL